MKKNEETINNYCVKCGNKLEKGQDFCPKCGTKIKHDDIKEDKKEEKEQINETPEVKLEETNTTPQKTKAGAVIRYIFAVLFALGSLSNLLNGNLRGILELLFALSLCPFVYKKFLCKLFKSPGSLKAIQIILPIALFITFLAVSPGVTPNDNTTNSGNSKSYFDADTVEERTKKAVYGNMYTKFQSINKFELNSETNKYDFEISNNKDEMTPYLCASDFKFLVQQEQVVGNENIGSIKFVCSNSEKTIYSVLIKDVSAITPDTIDSNMKYYDANNKEVNTNLDKLKQQIVDDYKKDCKSYKYKDVLRNPEDYKGKKAYWFGEITQVVEKSSYESTFRISVTCEKLSYSKEYYCPDTIYVTYYGDKSFIEDDMVKMWGTMEGTQTYTTVLGASVTIPKFNAKYMDLQ